VPAAAPENITAIGEALRDNDRNYVPDRLGETLLLNGVLISDPVNIRSFGPDSRDYATLANLQDGTGGIAIFTRNTGLLGDKFKRGDVLQVRGKLSQHNGMEELMITEVRRLGNGVLPKPHDVLAADVNSERFSGQLVRVTGELAVPSDVLETERGLVLNDRSGEVQVAISGRFFSNPNFVRRFMQGGKVDIVGIAGQYCKEPPFNSGYRLVPRDSADFGFVPAPPYRLIAISGGILLLSGFVIYSWLRRRGAERHARELTLLTENLRQSQEALRQSEERFRKVFEDGPVGIILGSPDMRILKANRALCRMLNYSEQELSGKKFTDVTHPDDIARSLEHAERLFRGDVSSYQLEKRYVTRDNKIIWAKVSVSLVRDKASAPVYALAVVEDITEQRRTGQALEQSEKRFRSLVENSSDSITLLDAEGTILYDAGSVTHRGLGYSHEEYLGRNAFELIHPNDLPETRRLLGELLKKPGAIMTSEYRVRHRDGSWRWIESTGTNLLQEPGVLAIVVNARDVTQRKQAEERLRQSEQRFSKAFHASPIAISIATLEEGRFIDVNESFLRLMGYTREEIIGRTAIGAIANRTSVAHTRQGIIGRTALELGMWLGAKDRDAFARKLREQGSIRDIESSFRTKTGAIRQGLGSAELIELNGEQCILCLIHDITERKQAEEAMRKSEERFQLIARATNDTVWDWDLSSNQLWWNEGIKSVFGYSIEEIQLDASWWDQHIHPEDRDRVLDGMRATIDSNELFWSAEYRYRRADRSYADVFDRGYVIRDDEGKPVRMIGAMMDITERKRFEVELAKARDEALESARLKSEFLANISHEVRTPLNGIIGMTVLLHDSGLAPNQLAFAETIQTSSESLLRIINDILDFSKLEAGKMNFEVLDFNLREAVETTIQLLAERAQNKHIELVSLVDSDVPALLRGDPGRLRQVITNLVVNAIKFTGQGEVVLRVAREVETGTHTTLCFTVRDTGIGIAPEALPYLFQAFSQADGSTTRKYGGTGLGLAISKQLVEMMGGQIGVESTPGKGSTFWFTIRLEKQTAAPVAAAVPAASVKGLKVLIADDSETNRSILIHQTASLGMRTACTNAGDEALRLLREAVSAGEPFDAAILDMQMPHMDGIALARSIKGDPAIAGTRILLMTSLGPRSDTAMLRAAGIGAFLVKPIKQSQLIECLLSITSATPQHETRFWLDRKEETVSPAAPRSTGTKPFHILVAEDNTINQRVATGLLEKLGFRSEAVANGAEVLKAMELVSYDIILMDCQLPELDGYKTTIEIRRREAQRNNGPGKRTQIIAMTAHAVRGAKEKCLAAGMDDYISKPVQLKELDAVLRRAISQLQAASVNPNGRPSAEHAVDPDSIAALRKLRRADGPDPVVELIDLFVRDTPARIAEMRLAATQYDHTRLAAEAHNLKGCASSIGAHQMATFCGELEERAEAKAIQVATRLLQKVADEFERVRAALELEKKN
jgi:PAS domain S-box-containing protein